ncbi:Dullard-like phosphatase domain containing protein, putative [Babesia bigemina]|uniref:Dullard-like phosphatase domain containing protein, putative n=1 Tax=Babesia bigemina TaxID=5866 RepID=A0A061D926_BABBI|nr:Dullard-like phosphatase domain containing protein, putative [Babesia bigemina]CDR97201.1 Dullard-like phosphatase domain containing protein, putative [Babesia bigemina]|eukprot:XP_012769387.1 Dullard-like phosphatase domain containing protein, putative [Babesia bigemina]
MIVKNLVGTEVKAMGVKPSRRDYLRRILASMRLTAGISKLKISGGRCCKLVDSNTAQGGQQDQNHSCDGKCDAKSGAPLKSPVLRVDNPRKKTLVLDLDETLVHSSFENKGGHDVTLSLQGENKSRHVYVNLRPFAREFVSAATRMFEVVIFTAATQDYANPVIDVIDCERRIRGRLFREYCTHWNGCYIKDLDIFDRDPKDIVIIDNTPVSYYLQPNNAIPVSSWHDNRNDRELVQLLPFLRKLSTASDVVPLLNERYPSNELNSDISRRRVQFDHLFPVQHF